VVCFVFAVRFGRSLGERSLNLVLRLFALREAVPLYARPHPTDVEKKTPLSVHDLLRLLLAVPHLAAT